MPVLARDESLSPSSSLGPTYIAGIALAGVIVLGLAIWLGIRHYRSRAQAKREKVRIAAFTPIRGIYKESETEKEPLPECVIAIRRVCSAINIFTETSKQSKAPHFLGNNLPVLSSFRTKF
jgi:hypothetical protein